MADNPFAGLPHRPSHIAEWEDLLVRYELGPRAVRHAVEEVEGDESAAASGSWRVADHLAHLAEREAEAGAWLQALQQGQELKPWAAAEAHRGASRTEPTSDLERYTVHRNRNFARVQRRGVDVWEWESSHALFGAVTAFQLLSYQVRHDGRHLARIREIRRADARPC
ncbi:MAG: hypothetical protein H0X65_11375 [Gemmatimonadetes bacterium]|nr:hypothetical protein [Gemmatimonadota bacterium]